MKQTELLIGLMLRIGLWLSVLIVLIGGLVYLNQCGNELIQYRVFNPPQQTTFSILHIWKGVMACSALQIIQFGLFLLILTQVLRVAMTSWLFIEQRDHFFSVISLCILAILVYSIFCRG